MNEEFISVQDRILSSAIDLISDAGLALLSFANISMRVNIPEAMIYKYYSDVNELLQDIVKTYFKFDKGIFKTISSRDCSYLGKIDMYVDSLTSYYENYFTLSTLILQHEELLHNTYTRDYVEQGIRNRIEFLTGLFQGAIDNKEITDYFTAAELANTLCGMFMMYTLDRRIHYRNGQFKSRVIGYVNKWLEHIKVGG